MGENMKLRPKLMVEADIFLLMLEEMEKTFMLEIFLSDGTQENFFQSALRNLLVTKLSKNLLDILLHLLVKLSLQKLLLLMVRTTDTQSMTVNMLSLLKNDQDQELLYLTKKLKKMHVVSMIVDGEKYIVEIPRENRHARREQVTLKINGQEKQVQEIKKVQREEMKETHVTKHEDGVYSIHSYKYGVEVLCDGERLMVRTNEVVFRNRATGLCGDLNGEETADLKTGRQCVLSESELTGLRFMLEDGKCRGIPEEKKTQIEREEERCVKEEVEPTIVSGIVTPKRSNPTERRQLNVKQGQKTCFSKNMIRSCNQSTPKEVRARQVGYVCMNGPKANVMERRVKSGDRAPELQNMPTDFSQTVYEPSQC